MPKPGTRWRVRPPVGPGENWSAEEFVPGGGSVSRISFAENGRAQATKWVGEHNRRVQGPNQLRDLLRADAHKAMRK